MSYACSHSAGWYVVSLEDAPRCITCQQLLPTPAPRDAARRLLVRGRPVLRLLQGGEIESGTTRP